VSNQPNRKRPIAPDLQVYRPTLTMTMSIFHRVTGAALYLGILLFIWWLVAAAMGPSAYALQQRFMGSIPGLLVLFGFTWALLHHSLGGVRHLIWDTGRAHDHPWREYLARATILGSLALTVLLWGVFYSG
jgi:succinate dehydrogenase / fumarate reductase cytochrome b subunit